MDKKKCDKCGLIKTVDLFHKNKTKKDGLSTRCKECKNEAQRKWLKEKGKEYYSKSEVKERRAKQNKEYRSKPSVKKRLKSYMKEYRSRPENIEREKKRRKTEKYQKLEKQYRECPIFKYKRKAYLQKYYEDEKNIKKKKEYLKEYYSSKKYKEAAKKRSKKDVESISDNYIKQLIHSQTKGGIKFSEVPEHLIKLKRQTIIFKRFLKKQENEQG